MTASSHSAARRLVCAVIVVVVADVVRTSDSPPLLPSTLLYHIHPTQFNFDAQGNLVVGWLKTTPVSARESQRLIAVEPIRTVEPISSLCVLPRADRSHKEECKSRASRSVASDGSTVSQADGQTEEAKPADRDCCIMSAWLKPFDCRAPVRSAASLPSLR